jgi:nitrilase
LEVSKNMSETTKIVKVAVVQAAPVLFERAATVEKACHLIQEAAGQGAELLLFPEAFIPGYPRGLSFGMVVGSRKPEGRQLWQRYWEASVEIPSPTTVALGAAARQAIGLHRKLKPTGAERLIWGEGDGSTLTVLPTHLGKIGGLICWENYMPLARMALYSKGVEIYLAPTADARETWQATLRHIACEGRCFVLGCNQFVTRSMYPADLQGHPELAEQPEVMCRGGSAVISPLGEVIAGPLYDQEGILYAELDLNEVVRARLDFDVVGHYARPDVFQLLVNEQPQLPVQRG